MTPPSLETAREILAGAAAKARSAGDAFAEIDAAAIDVVLAKLDRRGPRVVPFHDSEGRKIGDATVDGCMIVGKISDERAAAMLRASVRPRWSTTGTGGLALSGARIPRRRGQQAQILPAAPIRHVRGEVMTSDAATSLEATSGIEIDLEAFAAVAPTLGRNRETPLDVVVDLEAHWLKTERKHRRRVARARKIRRGWR